MSTGEDSVRRTFLRGPVGRALAALVLVLLVGALFPADGAFFKAGTHRDALRQASVYGILACGMTVVILSGGIDLAVGSVLALVAVCSASLAIHRGASAWITVPSALAIGAAAGGVSGLLVARFRMQPFIATLAMMVFARGLAKALSGGRKVSTAVQQADGSYAYVEVPRLFERLDGFVLGGAVSGVTLVFALCVLLAGGILARHRLGREILAVGGNAEAARLAGVRVGRTLFLAYVLSGLFAGIAGLLQAAQEQQGDPEAGVGYELVAIAMVVLGGTSLMGGRGGVGLTLLGVLTIGYLEKILSINAVPEPWRLMLTGTILVAAVLLQVRRR